MNNMRIVSLVSCLLFPTLVSAQDLAELARQERERREDIRQQGIASSFVGQRALDAVAREAEPSLSAAPELRERPGVLVLTQEDLEAVAGREAIIFTPAVQPVSPPPVLEPRGESFVQAPDLLPERPAPSLLSEEAMWRDRARQTRMRLEEARRLNEHLRSLNLPETSDMWTRAQFDLMQRESEWDRLLEDARRAGAPPGWLR